MTAKGKNQRQGKQYARGKQSAKTLTSDNIGNSGGGDEDEPQASCGDDGAYGGAEKPVT